MNKKSILAPDLRIEPSQLYVRDLDKVGRFYRDMVMLDVLEKTDSRWLLGQGNLPVLELIAKPEFNNANIRSAGLFHNAILFNSRADLSRTVLNILQKSFDSFEGTGDHLVSEAFYFHDPEGNGLELYYDLPRENWQWVNGQVRMDTLRLDPEQYIMKKIEGKTGETKELGHVHLKVGDVDSARRFYVDQLGFDTTLDMGSALFVSVGGYHHHLAMNTWASRGVGEREPSLGLAEVKLILPDTEKITNLAKRLDDSSVRYSRQDEYLRVNDPWGNKLLFVAE